MYVGSFAILRHNFNWITKCKVWLRTARSEIQPPTAGWTTSTRYTTGISIFFPLHIAGPFLNSAIFNKFNNPTSSFIRNKAAGTYVLLLTSINFVLCVFMALHQFLQLHFRIHHQYSKKIIRWMQKSRIGSLPLRSRWLLYLSYSDKYDEFLQSSINFVIIITFSTCHGWLHVQYVLSSSISSQIMVTRNMTDCFKQRYGILFPTHPMVRE